MSTSFDSSNAVILQREKIVKTVNVMNDDFDLIEKSYSMTINEDSFKSMNELKTSLSFELKEDD